MFGGDGVALRFVTSTGSRQLTDRYKNQEQVFATLRADLVLRDDTPLDHLVTVKEVVRDIETAKR